MNVTPFQLLKPGSALLLAGRAGAALARWGADWCALPDHAVRCAAASEQRAALEAGPEPRRRALDDGTAFWAAVPDGVERYLEQLVFGLPEAAAGPPSSALGGDVAGDALEALLHGLAEGLTGHASRSEPGAPVPRALLRQGSGAVVCLVQLGKHSLRLLLPPAALPPAAHPPAIRSGTAPLASLRQALRGVPVRLEVELCSTELTLGYLNTLAVGDVLALPAGVEQALRVTGPGGAEVCHAHLGARDGHRAVELLKTNHQDKK